LPFIESGKLCALAVTTKERSPVFRPPHRRRAPAGFVVALGTGLFVPNGRPRAIVDRLAAV